jgi:hypothetical protein
MLQDVVEVSARPGHHLYVRFEDGVEGEVDVARIVRFTGVFAILADPAEFSKVQVGRETGTVTWPNGADIDPLVLYARVTGQSVESLLGEPTPTSSG